MEVHQHSHTPRKKWTHYFWEFLMLFLAVTAGFFMENQREHYIEHKRAKVLAKSLLEDIKKDSAALNEAMAFSNIKIKSMNNLVALMHQPFENWDDSLLYEYSYFFPRVAPFVSTQGTYEQIKNSGSLRYFPQDLVSLLNAYNVFSKRAEDRDGLDTKIIVETFIPFCSGLLNFEVYNDLIYNLPITHARYNKIKDREVVDRFINYVVNSRRSRERSIFEYEELLKLADKIFKEVKKEYHLE